MSAPNEVVWDHAGSFAVPHDKVFAPAGAKTTRLPRYRAQNFIVDIFSTNDGDVATMADMPLLERLREEYRKRFNAGDMAASLSVDVRVPCPEYDDTDPAAYNVLRDKLNRLQNTTIHLQYEEGNEGFVRGFSWIGEYVLSYSTSTSGHRQAKVLTINVGDWAQRGWTRRPEATRPYES